MSAGEHSDERGAVPELPPDRARQSRGPSPSRGEVEAALAHALEARAVAAAQRSGAPTADERAALARMAAHMDAAPHFAGAGAGPAQAAGASSGVARAHRRRGAALVGCAALLGLVVWFGLPDTLSNTGPNTGPTTGPVSRPSGAAPDVYLGTPADPAAFPRFPGRVTWDDGGDGGFVRVRVFDLDRPAAPWLELETRGTVFEHTGPLPARFELCVDRLADDGLGSEELLRQSFAAP